MAMMEGKAFIWGSGEHFLTQQGAADPVCCQSFPGVWIDFAGADSVGKRETEFKMENCFAA